MLKRRLQKDSSFHVNYAAFMNDLIAKDYAERVPEEELKKFDFKVKWTLRGVLQCLPLDARGHHGLNCPFGGTFVQLTNFIPRCSRTLPGDLGHPEIDSEAQNAMLSAAMGSE